MKRKITGLLILAVFISMFSVTGCYNDDEARVTIHIERNDLIGQKPVQKKWFIDRILEFFSSPAYGKWSDNRNSMKLQITSTSFDTMNFNLPYGSTEFTTIIPSGNNVRFLITTEGDSSGAGIQKMWGGESIVDVSPGEKEISIKMIPMTYINGSVSAEISLYWLDFSFSTIPVNATGFYIYRSTNINGPYSRIHTVTSMLTTGWLDNISLVGGTTYYYKISVYGSDGEGVRSDPKAIYFP